MRKWWLCAVLAAISASASAQDQKKSQGEEKVGFEKRAFPFEGEVSVERLNVRLFPKADQTSIITSVLGLGEKVVVVGEKEDFFQIRPPRGSTVWVFGKSIKKEGATGVAMVNDVPVRLDSRVNADTLCTLKEGDQVKIAAEHMGWYKIDAPDAVKYYVGKKYVRTGKAEGSVVHAPYTKDEGKKPVEAPRAAATGFRTKMNVAEALLDEERKKIDAQKLDEVDFSGVVAAYEEALSAAATQIERVEAERGVKRYRDLQVIWQTHKALLADEQARVRARIEEANKKPVPEKKAWAMAGYIDTCGLLWKRPGTHKLIMGGKIVCFLRVKEGDEKMISHLNDMYQKYVGVNGVVIRNPEGWDGYSVIVVEEVTPITKE